MTVLDLTQGAEYSFTVAGIDTGGRMGEESASATVKLDSELCQAAATINPHVVGI